jgi:hypothetical protein
VLTLASFAVTKLAYVRLTKLFREAYIKAAGEGGAGLALGPMGGQRLVGTAGDRPRPW